MRPVIGTCWILTLILVLAAPTTGVLQAQSIPRMLTVTPDTAKAGDVVTVEGESMEKANVAELYLTDGKNDLKVEVVEQAATVIKFKVPATVKPGRFSLMVLTGGSRPQLIEQPVRLTVE